MINSENAVATKGTAINLSASWAEIEHRVDRAKNRFLKYDQQLLKLNANERSMTHRFAVHLQDEFPGMTVDCEYNRDGESPKTLAVHGSGNIRMDDTDARTVYPDIIVHKRGSRCNLLVIEAKKSGHDTCWDRLKLRSFLDNEGFGYRYAILLIFEIEKLTIHCERVQ